MGNCDSEVCSALSEPDKSLDEALTVFRNGGEKNYLEYVYQKPKFLATTMYAAYTFLLGWAASNSVVFGQYILNAADIEVDRWNQRGIGLACITAAFLIHALAVKWGIYFQNFLGIVKLIVILIIVVAGWVALAGHMEIDNPPHNFANAFDGTTESGYGIVMALYNVIWSFIGYSNANYVSGIFDRLSIILTSSRHSVRPKTQPTH